MSGSHYSNCACHQQHGPCKSSLYCSNVLSCQTKKFCSKAHTRQRFQQGTNTGTKKPRKQHKSNEDVIGTKTIPYHHEFSKNVLLPSFQFVERVCSHRTMSAARSALVAPLLHPGNFSKMPKSCLIGRASSCACASVHVLIFSVSSTPLVLNSSISLHAGLILSLTCALGWLALLRRPFWHHFQRFHFGLRLSHCAPLDGLLLGEVCRGSSAANCVAPCHSRNTFSCNWRSYAARNALFSSSS